ncbi:MAG: exosome complex exonuclease Rrp41 [Candidatus Korarchaeota archaeon]|nr:exosome complex exonuclease Rrp41 [Thermoproteota archaeon]MCR8501363.1 exosome complex exonuclease Rrp41 [Thermoproteota archaeon]
MSLKISEEEFKKILESGKRVDGRAFTELRPINIRLGIVERAEGSCLFEMGHTKVLCVVRGPTECVPAYIADPERAVLDVAYRMCTFSTEERKSPTPSRREVELSKVIREALEPSILLEEFPRMMIKVYCLVLQADAGTRTASINAASLALAQAGIPLRDLVTSVAVGYCYGNIVVDVCSIEDELCADIPIAMLPAYRKITLLQSDHRLPIDRLSEILSTAIKAIDQIYELQKKALKEYYLSSTKAGD